MRASALPAHGGQAGTRAAPSTHMAHGSRHLPVGRVLALLPLQLLLLLPLRVANVAAVPGSVSEYKQALNLEPGGQNSIITNHDINAMQARCQEALQNLATHWNDPATRMHRLHKPSYAFRLQNAPPKPELADLLQVNTATQMWRALLERIIRGDWIDPAWRTQPQQPWTFEHFCHKFVLLRNGNLPPHPKSLCIPLNTTDIPPASGPLHTRHYICAHPNGYIMVNLGTDQHGRAVSIPLHTILAVAFHGTPQEVEHSDNSDIDGDLNPHTTRFQEVSHMCGNPWCICYRHIRWDSHKGNCRHRPQGPD